MDAFDFALAPAYCTPTQTSEASLTAAPASNPTVVFAPCATVTVAVSRPLDGNASDSSNVLAAVSAPTFAEISTRGWEDGCAAAGVAPATTMPSTATDHEITQL